jgi:uncharacterized DUF497 family protein
MIVTWDQHKQEINLSKHGIDFQDAQIAFRFPTIERIDDRLDYGEERYIGIGIMHGTIIVMVYTYRDDGIRLISARRAKRNERKIYTERFGPG